jgi:hypothetical protein
MALAWDGGIELKVRLRMLWRMRSYSLRQFLQTPPSNFSWQNGLYGNGHSIMLKFR